MCIERIPHLNLLVHRPLIKGATIHAHLHKPHATVLLEEVIDASLRGIESDPIVGHRLLVPINDLYKLRHVCAK